MPDRSGAIFDKIQYNLGIARKHESNVTYWNIVLVALQEEEPLFAGDINEYRGKENAIHRKIRRNERAMTRYYKRADRLLRRYPSLYRGEHNV